MVRFAKKFAQFCFVFSVCFAIICIIDVFLIGNQYSEGYPAALADKMERLCTLDEPKIILVGDSNVAFGFRSEMIEKAFQMPVVNLGLHGGLGNSFHENMALQNIGEGDIVIVCHSDYNENGRISDIRLVWTAMEYNTQLWRLVLPQDRLDFWLAYPNYVMNAYSLLFVGTENYVASGCYSRAAFNKYGDNVYSKGEEKTYVFDDDFISHAPEIGSVCVENLNKMNEYITSRGATLLVAGYPIAYTNEVPNSVEFENFQKRLQEKLHCPVISNYTDYFYPEQFFYDTIYHLNDMGARERTQQLIDDLTAYLQE